MTDLTPDPEYVGLITRQLDDVLRRAIAKRDRSSEIRRDLREVENELSALDGEAQRLRMALFALRGVDANAGKANAENHERSMELRRAES